MQTLPQFSTVGHRMNRHPVWDKKPPECSGTEILQTSLMNHMELLETIVKTKPKEEEITVHLITVEDELRGEQQKERLEKIRESCSTVGVTFTWEFEESSNIHARHIVTDHGWKILLDRGLDIFQYYEMNDCFTFANRLQQFRACKAFEVMFLKNEAK